LEALLDTARALTRRTVDKREEANAAAVAAAQALEEKLVEALCGEALKGLPNLLPDGKPLHALRVNNSGTRHGAAEYLPRDGREVLVLARDGRLYMVAWQGPGEGALMRRAAVEDFKADLLEPLVRAVQEALEAHIARTEKREKTYEEAAAFAEKLAGAVGMRFR
jgi:hypothetical protein